MTIRLPIALTAVLALGQFLAAQVSPERLLNAQKEPQNWLTYSGSYYSQRYSPLNQIRPTNARDLELKWVYQTRSLERREFTPLVVNGVMYVGNGTTLRALDGATGKELWNSGTTITSFAHCGALSGGMSQIYLTTYDGTIYAFGFPMEH